MSIACCQICRDVWVDTDYGCETLDENGLCNDCNNERRRTMDKTTTSELLDSILKIVEQKLDDRFERDRDMIVSAVSKEMVKVQELKAVTNQEIEATLKETYKLMERNVKPLINNFLIDAATVFTASTLGLIAIYRWFGFGWTVGATALVIVLMVHGKEMVSLKFQKPNPDENE